MSQHALEVWPKTLFDHPLDLLSFELLRTSSGQEGEENISEGRPFDRLRARSHTPGPDLDRGTPHIPQPARRSFRGQRGPQPGTRRPAAWGRRIWDYWICWKSGKS